MMLANKNRVLKHGLFWLGIFIFYSFLVAERELFKQFVETALFRLPLLMIAAYLLNYWQVPKFFRPKKYAMFGLSLLITTLLLILIYRLMGYLYLDKYCDSDLPYLSFVDFSYHLLSFHSPALIMYFYQSNALQNKESQRIIELQKQKITTELKYLKAQLNPHFLFNTLNNLYSFVINKSPQAGDIVLQLSEMLDYTIYKSQNTFVLLSEEVKAIKNYIALEKIRYGNHLKVSFNIMIDDIQKACPLLFLSIVENAFKHGANSSMKSPEIKIFLEQRQLSTSFKVWNTKPHSGTSNKNVGNDEERVGLINVKRQLGLMYPENHKLIIENTEKYFNLELTLTTKE